MSHDPGQRTEKSARSPSEVVADPTSLSTTELLEEIGHQVSSLARAELDLAKNELRANLLDELKMATGLSAAGIMGLMAINLLLVTAVFALATLLPGWAAGLIVTGVVLLAAAVTASVGWSKRVRQPLRRTRREMKEDAPMGQESSGIEDVGLQREGRPSPEGGDAAQTVDQLAARAEAIRGNLDTLVDEVQRRGKRALKPLAIGAGCAALLALVVGGAFAWRRHGQRPPPSRLRGLARALRRMSDHPERVAEEQPSLRKKVLASAGATLASVVVHQLAQVAREKMSRGSGASSESKSKSL
jgi:hypothetical protein